MNTLILSYSYTGRNKELSSRIAKTMGMDHIEVVEKKNRKMITIIADMLFKRTPKVSPDPSVMDKYDIVVLCAPIWMGMPASPMTSYLKHLAKTKQKYIFVSLSGGSDHSNPDFPKHVHKITGYKAVDIVDVYVRDLLPKEPAPTRDTTQHYPITPSEYDKLSSEIITTLSEVIG